MNRRRITDPLATGQRAIDGLLTVGRGQRLGLFAGSGVGKSTLLGEIAKYASADVNVVALVGERSREVAPFIDDCLQQRGREKSVVVVATSDETPVMKIQAVKTALTIAEHFRENGANVLFFLDSLTRFANAQREVGLSRGEMPTQRGYPTSVQSLLASTLERIGNSDRGTMTGIITVLVDGDDFNDPIADAARSILDGHIVLDRELAAKGHFPAIDVLRSLSRLFPEIATPPQQEAARNVRRTLSICEDMQDLLNLGLYQRGTSSQIDAAFDALPVIHQFLQQHLNDADEYTDIQKHLLALADSPSPSLHRSQPIGAH